MYPASVASLEHVLGGRSEVPQWGHFLDFPTTPGSENVQVLFEPKMGGYRVLEVPMGGSLGGICMPDEG